MKKPGLLDLRPTQFVLGMKEIEAKAVHLSKLSPKDLTVYCNDHVIPVVLGPQNQSYLIDHHHFARACWEQRVEQYSVKVVKDLSHKNEQDFWNIMIKQGWCYLNDQFGMGPHPPAALPSDVRCLADDPYRSLVYEVIHAGYIKKDKVPFFEFQWAAFFRLNLDARLHSKSNFKNAIKLAIKLSRSKAARNFPGYTGDQ
jgi:hypothetical protein